MLPVTLWVFAKKMQVKALVDLGTNTSFINCTFVKQNHLTTYCHAAGIEQYVEEPNLH